MNFPDQTAAITARERLAAGCDAMKQLLPGLLDSKGRIAEEVHALRKLGKSLRGGFTMFRLEKSAGREIQAIGRLLSGPRDAASRQSTWTKLDWTKDAKVSAAISGLLEQHTHAAARRPPPEVIGWCIERVDAALKELAELRPEEMAETVGRGLKQLERRVNKRCRKLDLRAEADFHEARKAVKALLGAAGFLPDGSLPLDPKLHDLAELLGDENDLAILSRWLDCHGFKRRFAPDLWKNIQADRRKLQKQVIREARRDFRSL